MQLTPRERLANLEFRYSNGLISAHEYEFGTLEAEFYTAELKQTDEYKLRRLDLQRSYDEITAMDYELQSSDILNKNIPDVEKKIKKLDILLRYGQIDAVEHDKEVAHLKGIPFCKVMLDGNPDKEGFSSLYTVFNKEFVDVLRKKHYAGETDDDVVASWVGVTVQEVAQSEDFGIEHFTDSTELDDVIDEEYNAKSST